jgi:hypothetical protein
LIQNIGGPLLIIVEITFQEVGEKEKSQNGKHNEKLKQDDPPEFFSPCHSPEAIKIEMENFLKHRSKINNNLFEMSPKQDQMYYFYLIQIIKILSRERWEFH